MEPLNGLGYMSYISSPYPSSRYLGRILRRLRRSMGEPPRDGKKNDVQREDEIRRLQEMVSSLQVGVEELKKKPRKGSRKLKRRPSRTPWATTTR